MALVRTNSRWPRAVAFGILAELSTIVTVVFITTVHSVVAGGPMIDTTSEFATIWGGAIGIVGGAFFVYVFARWIGSLVSARFVAHGLVVAAAAVAMHLLGSLNAAAHLRTLQYGADVLKLAAGAFGGWIASRNVQNFNNGV